MKQSHSYEKCYKLLNINIDCSWEELRKAYRTLVHKWHPDRCVDEKEKALATDKVKDLNTAYKQLSDYYNKHEVLPLFPPLIQAVKPSPTVTKEELSSVKATKVSPTRKQIKSKQKSNLKSIFIFAVVVITVAIIYPYLNSIVMTMPTQFDSADEALLSKKNVFESKAGTKKKKKIKTKIETEYFTYGSTLGEVVLIQGPPDKTIGEVWFYGESEIHFEDGLVIEWLRTANNPLKARDLLIPDKKKTESANFK